MYDLKQAEVTRAIDILRNGALSSADFSMKMWPDRTDRDGNPRSRGSHTLAGSALLHRLMALGYVEKIGDLWMVRRISASSPVPPAGLFPIGSPNGSPNHFPNGFPGYSPGYSPGDVPGMPPGYSPGDPVAYPTNGHATQQAERLRLARLVHQAAEPVESVTHDAAFGDIRIRSIALDGALAEACAIVVLSGRSANVYLPCGAAHMLVGLSPAESARTLFLCWAQSGQPPELPRPSAWITVPDGIVASSGFWRPAGAPAGWVDPEDVRARIHRQRVAAGLA